jgi:hypothetical protein
MNLVGSWGSRVRRRHKLCGPLGESDTFATRERRLGHSWEGKCAKVGPPRGPERFMAACLSQEEGNAVRLLLRV